MSCPFKPGCPIDGPHGHSEHTVAVDPAYGERIGTPSVALRGALIDFWASECADPDDGAFIRSAPETAEMAALYVDALEPTLARLIAEAEERGAAKVAERVEAVLAASKHEQREEEPPAWRRGARHVRVMVATALKDPS